MKCWQVIDPNGRVAGVNLCDGLDLRFLPDGYSIRCRDAVVALSELADAIGVTTAAKAPSEPPPEDVATPALDRVQTYTACITGGEDEAMEADRDGVFVVKSEAKDAYRRDLAAGIAAATESIRKNNDYLCRENDDLRRQLREKDRAWSLSVDARRAK